MLACSEPGAGLNYYERHLGDYAKDTGHLTMLEHGAYNLLLDRYYATESGIPADQAYRVARARTKEERDAVDVVLLEFFTLDAGVYAKKRCEEELERARAKITAARQNGRNGGRPRKTQQDPTGFSGGANLETQPKPTGLLLGSKTETQTKALQTPDSNLHTPERVRTRADALADARAVVGLNTEAFDRWIGYRAERKPAIKPASMTAAAKELAAFGPEQAAVVQHSIANGYQGLFAKKLNGNHPAAKNGTSTHAQVMAALDAAVDPNSPEEWPT